LLTAALVGTVLFFAANPDVEVPLNSGGRFGADVRVGGVTPNFATGVNGNWEAGIGLGGDGSKTSVLVVSHHDGLTKFSIAYRF
jgi:hypothetical protein